MDLFCALKVSWNNQPSILHQNLTQIYGNAEADRVISKVYSDQFKEVHGDFVDCVSVIPTDAIGFEPTLEWVQTNLKPQVHSSRDRKFDRSTEDIYNTVKAIWNRNKGKHFFNDGFSAIVTYEQLAKQFGPENVRKPYYVKSRGQWSVYLLSPRLNKRKVGDIVSEEDRVAIANTKIEIVDNIEKAERDRLIEEADKDYDNYLNGLSEQELIEHEQRLMSVLPKRGVQDLLVREKYFKEDGPTTSEGILKAIAKSEHRLAGLAKHLLPYVDVISNVQIRLVPEERVNFTGAGVFKPSTNIIEIAEFAAFRGVGVEPTIIHEIIHSLTYNALRNNSKYVQIFEKMYQQAVKHLGTYNKETGEGYYGTLNLDEFMTELFTNAEFIKALQNIPAEDTTKYKNLWEEILDTFLGLLNLTEEKNPSLYKQAFTIATNIIEDHRNYMEAQFAENDYYENYFEPDVLQSISAPNQDTLDTTNYSPTPVKLSEDQEEAAKVFNAFMSDPKATTMALTGYAGTGKTFLTKHLLSTLRRGAVVTATTHRAKEVLKDNLKGSKVITLAAALGLGPGIDLADYNLDNPMFRPTKKPKVSHGDLLIIDESSMVNEELFRNVERLAKDMGLKVLFIGDAGQLKPVKSKVITIAFTESEYKTNMTQIMRTKGDNPLSAEVLQPLRDNPKSKTDKFEHKTTVNTKGEGIEFTSDTTKFDGMLKTAFTSQDAKDNLLYVRAVAFTNDRVKTLNHAIRRSLFGTSPEMFMEGELMMMYDNKFYTGDDYLLSNGADLVVKGVKHDVVNTTLLNYGIETKGVLLTLHYAKDNSYRKEIFIPYSVPAEYVVLLRDAKNKALKLGKEGRRQEAAKAWGNHGDIGNAMFVMEDIYEYKGSTYTKKQVNTLVRADHPKVTGDALDKMIGNYKVINKTIDYGYAHTIHKSQGGTYNTIFVDENDIDVGHSFQNPDYELINQLKYVGFSRSSQKTFVLSNKAENNAYNAPEFPTIQTTVTEKVVDPTTTIIQEDPFEVNKTIEQLQQNVVTSDPFNVEPVGINQNTESNTVNNNNNQNVKGEVVERYSNEDVKNNPNKIYVFGDNLDRTGTGGQAQIRNNPNAFGIATKIHPTNNADAFMSDNQLVENKKVIDEDIQKIISQNKSIVFAKDGYGTGLAKLKEKAPQTYQYLKEQLLEKFGFNNDTGNINQNVTNSQNTQVVNSKTQNPKNNEKILVTLDPIQTENGTIYDIHKSNSFKIKPEERMSNFDMKALLRNQIIEKAKANPNAKFYLPWTNPVEHRFADAFGFTERDYAQLLQELRIEGHWSANISASAAFTGQMNNNVQALATEFLSDNRVLWKLDKIVFEQLMSKSIVPLVDLKGNNTGSFSDKYSTQAQQDITDLITRQLFLQLEKGGKTVDVTSIIKGIITKLKTPGLPEIYIDTINSMAFHSSDKRVSFLSNALTQLKNIGVELGYKDKIKIMNLATKWKAMSFEELKTLTQYDKVSVDFISADALKEDEEIDNDSVEVEKSSGERNTDYNTVNAMIDSRDTMNSRTKLYLQIQNEYVSFTYDDTGIITGVVPIETTIKGNPKMVNMDVMFTQIQEQLTNVHNLDGTTALTLLRNSGNPNLWKLADRIEKEDPNKKEAILNQLLAVFNVSQVRKSTVIAKKKINSVGAESTQIFIADPMKNASLTQVAKKWQNAFKMSAMAKTNDNGVVSVNKEKAQKQLKFLSFVKKALESQLDVKQWKDDAYKKGYNDKIAELSKEFEAVKHEFADIYTGTFEELITDEFGTMEINPNDPTRYKFTSAKIGKGKREKIGKALQNLLNLYGIEFTDKTIAALISERPIAKGSKDWRPAISVMQGTTATWASHFGFDGNNIGTGVFSKLVGFSAQAQIDKDEIEIEEADEFSKMTNPLFTRKDVIQPLVKTFIQSSDTQFVNSFTNVDGERINGTQAHNSMSLAVLELKNDPKKFFDRILATKLGEAPKDGTPSFYIRNLKDGDGMLAKYDCVSFDGLSAKGSGKSRVDFSDREQGLVALAQFLTNNSRTKYATCNLISVTNSDKTETLIHNNLPKLEVGKFVLNNTKVITPGVIIEFSKLLQGEMNRVHLGFTTDIKDANYKEGAKQFLLFPFLNHDVLSDKFKPLFYTEDGTWIEENTDERKTVLVELLTEFLNTQVQQTTDYFKEIGITHGYLDARVHKKYTEQYNEQLEKGSKDTEYALLSAIKKGENVEENTKKLQEIKEAMMDHVLKDYALNSMLFNISSAILFNGDPALTYKYKEGRSVAENRALTMAEVTKRLAKDLAPGTQAVWKAPTYNSITLTDFNDTIKLEMSNLSKMNATDAQEVTTVAEHLEFLYTLGRIDKKLFDELMEEVKNPKKDSPSKGEYPWFTNEQLEQMIQPLQAMKPVYAGFRDVAENGTLYYDYIKSSAYPLFPQQTIGLEIDKLRKLMEDPNNNIRRAAFESAKKIGTPVGKLNLFNKDGTIRDNITNEEVRGATTVLYRKNLRVQQEVPHDALKEKIKAVTQMNKLIVEGITHVKDFMIGNQIFASGKEVRKFKEDIYAKMVKLNLDKLVGKLSTGNDKDGNYIISKTKLIAALVEAANEPSSGITQNEIDFLETGYDGDFIFPLNLHSSAEKFESLVTAMITKVVEVKMTGKSYVQASSAGHMRVKSADGLSKSNIVFTNTRKFDGSKPLAFATYNGKGKAVSPMQVYAPFNFTITRNGKKVKADINDYLITEGHPDYIEGTKAIDMDKVPAELLELVGARIPNQGHNSMVPIEIVGFVDNWLGDIMYVANGIVAQMGSDFDVDKLFTYKRPYTWDEKTNKFTGTEFKGDKAESLEELQRAYFDTHWGILTHHEIYPKVASALDRKDLKTASAKFKTSKNNYFYNQIEQLKGFQNGKDAKKLVAYTSLNVVFNSVIQNKNLRLGTYVSDSGVVREIEESMLLNGLDLTHLSGYGMTDIDGEMVSKHVLQTLAQSASVDNVKDRDLDNLNITVETYPALAAMFQLQTEDTLTEDDELMTPGKVLDPAFATSMLVQEIMWEYSKRIRKVNDFFSEDFSSKAHEDTISALRKEYAEKAKMSESDTGELHNSRLTTKTLEDTWKTHEKGENKSNEYYKVQLAVLNSFEKLHGIGKRLNELQKIVNQDTKGMGRNFIYANSTLEMYENLHNHTSAKIFLGEPSILEGEQGKLFSYVMELAQKLNPLLTNDTLIVPLLEKIAINKKVLKHELGQKTLLEISRGIRSALMTSSPFLSNDIQGLRFNLLYGKNSMANQLIKMQHKHKTNYLLNNLRVNEGTTYNDPSTIYINNAGHQRMDKELNTKAFVELLTSTNKEDAEFALNLAKYGLSLMPQAGNSSFTSIIPAGLLLSTFYAEDMKIAQNFVDDEILIRQVVQHQPKLAIQISQKVLDSNFNLNKLEFSNYPEVISFSATKAGDSNPLHDATYIGSDKNGAVFQPFISYYSPVENKHVLYEQIPIAGGSTIIYKRIDVLGKGAMVEYDLNSEKVRSIFPENRALTEDYVPNHNYQLLNEVQKKIEETDAKEPFQKWGLKEGVVGDKESLITILHNVSNDVTLPRYLRSLAGIHATTDLDMAEAEMTKLIAGAKGASVQITLSSGDSRYEAKANRITLKTGNNPLRAAEELLHETVHLQSSRTLALFGYNKSLKDNKTYQELVEANKKAHPELWKKIQTLDSLRLEAMLKYTEKLEAQGFTMEQIAEMQFNVIQGVVHEGEELLYALHNLEEFMAHVLTNKETMEFLNTIESTTATERRSFIDTLLDAVFSMFAEIAYSFGITVNDRAILKEAYSLAYSITTREYSTQNATKTENNTSESIDPLEDVAPFFPSRISFKNEQEKRDAKHIIEDIHNIKTEEASTFLEDVLNVTNFAKTVTGDPVIKEIQIVSKLMTKQLRQLEAIGNYKAKTPEEESRKAQALEYHDTIAQDLVELEHQNELIYLQTIAKKQMEWVQDIVNKVEPHFQEVNIAVSLLSLWKGLDVLHQFNSTVIDKEFLEFQGKVLAMHQVLMPKLAKATLNAIQNLGGTKGMKLELADITDNLVEVGIIEAKTINYGRNANKVIQLVSALLQQSKNNAQEAEVKLRKEMEELRKEVKAVSGMTEAQVYDSLLDIEADLGVLSIIQPVKGGWFSSNNNSRSTMVSTLMGLNVTGIDPVKKLASQRAAISKYWKSVGKNSHILDYTKLFDSETGDNALGFDAYITELNAICGSEITVKDIVEKARTSYKRYITARTSKKLLIENETTLDASDLAGMAITGRTEAETLSDKKTRFINYWISRNSPNDFYNTLDIKAADSTFNHTGRYTPLVIPLKGSDAFNTKFDKLSSNSQLRALHTKFSAYSKRFTDIFPDAIGDKLGEGYVPLVKLNAIQNISGIVSGLKQDGFLGTMFNAISVGVNEIEENTKSSMTIPWASKSKKDIETSFKDLTVLLQAFGSMAIQYEHMAPMNDLYTFTRNILNQENEKRVRGGESGLPNLIALLDYNKKVLIDNVQMKHSTIGDKRYDVSPKQHEILEKRVEDLNKRIKELEEETRLITDKDDPKVIELKKALKELHEIENNARFFSGSKIMQGMIKMNQLKAMAFNPISAVSNFTFGMIAGHIYSKGFRVTNEELGTTVDHGFTQAQWAKSLWLLRGNYVKYYSLGTKSTLNAQKITNIMDRLGFIDALIDTYYEGNKMNKEQKNLFKTKLMKALDPMGWQKAGDFVSKAAVALSMLSNKHVEVMVGGKPTMVSLLDCLDDSGYWDTAKYGEKPEWETGMNTEWSNFRDKIRKTSLLVWGNQDPNRALWLRETWWGRAIGQFRLSWVPEGYFTRWGKAYEDLELGTKVEGRYRTAMKLGPKTYGKVLLKQILSIVSKSTNPFDGVQIKDIETYEDVLGDTETREIKRNLQDYEIENLRRNAAGLAYTLGVTILVLMLKHLKSLADDDDEKAKFNIGINILLRTKQDLSFFANPLEAEKILGSLVPSLAVLKDMGAALKALGKLADEDADIYEDILLKWMKAFPYINNIPKLKNMSERTIDNIQGH
jgi:hypothetical protein